MCPRTPVGCGVKSLRGEGLGRPGGEKHTARTSSSLTPGLVGPVVRAPGSHDPRSATAGEVPGLETRAENEFELPKNSPKKLRAGYLAYLGEALATTCTPTIWPPLGFIEWRIK